ncbi:MAG: ABC transporter substrate-binding protein, partial [Mesorhizobium sp.]
LGRTVFKDLTAVETPDELTAIFKFAKPTPFQLIRNALPALSSVVPKHVYESGKIEENPANNAPVGTGPYKFAEYKAGQYYRLAKNADYWGKGEPYLDEIVYQVLPDRTSAAAAL